MTKPIGPADGIFNGSIRYAGVSNFAVEQMRRDQAIFPVTSLQPPYSMLRREIESEILPFCLEQNIGVICYSPMYKGLITGKFSPERAAALPESDHRRRDPQFQPPLLERNLALVAELTALAEAAGHTMAELAVTWTLCHPAMTGAIVGLRHPRQAEVLRAGNWELDETTAKAVGQAIV